MFSTLSVGRAMKRRFASLCAFVFVCCLWAAASDVATIFATVSLNQDEPAWAAAESLARLGRAAREDIAEAASHPGRIPSERIAASGALLLLGDERGGVAGLEAVAMDPTVPYAQRREALQTLGQWGGEYAAARLGIMLDAPGLPERMQVEAAAALWKLTARPRAYEVLENIRMYGTTPYARADAVLALAQTDRYAYVYDELRRLAEMPGETGLRASALLLANSNLDEDIKRDDFTMRLISEIVQKVRDFYAVDEDDEEQAKRLQPKALAESSASALLYSLDPFSDYLNEEDFGDFEAQLKANYGGIGAWVGMRDGRFTVLTPMYDKPAYRAGLKPMDVIDRIDDTDITSMKQNDIIKMLKGEPNTRVKVRVWRRSWKEPRELWVDREIITIESVVHQLLPGGYGYIKINSFNDGDPYRRVKGTAALVRDALEEFNRLNCKGIILDLSNNPGGVMVSGVDVAKQFIGESKLIVSSRGRKSSRRATEYKAGLGRPYYRKPVVVVVNGGSASAAEILAGAMRDHKRAPLVGRKTFGKGSVQSLIGVRTTREKSRIKLTIAKYYLPNGDCIHEKGIEPDYKVPLNDLPVAEAEARWKIRDQHDVAFWLEENNRWDRYEHEYRRLLEFDNMDWTAYPEFESLYDTLVAKYPKERIDHELVRKEIRYGIAAYLRDFKGEQQHVDLEENPALIEAMMVLGDATGGLPDTPLFGALRRIADENRAKLAEEDADSDGK